MTVATEPFAAVDLIAAKRDKHELSDEHIDWFVDAYVRNVIAEEQMSAMAMAILLNGMSRREIVRWTNAYVNSGERMDWSRLGKATADKHSTGGVGDKITLILNPVVAACGVSVPQLSGRGLGHTGGTLDKLEAIPGWRAQLTNEEMFSVLNSVGAVICAASDTLAPADRRIYALRDVTATVESIPLISASIMSKKIAEGTGALVLDVKVGSGAFMKTVEQARELAHTMVGIGNDAGVTTRALLTAMDVPLGRTAGNALEVHEVLEVLAGGGPSDVIDLTVALAREMLDAATSQGAQPTRDPADVLNDGTAMDVWRKMISAQGGDVDAYLPLGQHSHTVVADSDGFLTRLDAFQVGVASWRLGAGRARKEDAIDMGAGVRWHAVPGEAIHAGQPLFTLHTNDEARIKNALVALSQAFSVGAADDVQQRLPLIIDRIV